MYQNRLYHFKHVNLILNLYTSTINDKSKKLNVTNSDIKMLFL